MNILKPGSILITKTAQDGSTLLPGACFGLDRGSGVEIEACDQESSDGDGEDGIIYFAAVPAGKWTLVETQAPDGYDPAADQDITVQPGKTVNLTVKDTPTPPPAQKGNLTVKKVDSKGKPLAGACFALRQGNVVKDQPLRQRRRRERRHDHLHRHRDRQLRSARDQAAVPAVSTGGGRQRHDYQQPDQDRDGGQYPPARPVGDPQGESAESEPLQGGCFTISPDPNKTGQLCTDASGQVTFSNLPTDKTYKITETKAPNGYDVAPVTSNISLAPGLTTTVVVVDKKTQPKPTDGSLQVIKFFCPAGSKGATTETINTSNPSSSSVLSQTAKCTKGDATFTLKPKSGGTTITFNTGSDGQYQTTLKAGTYVLTEKSSGKSVNLTIFVGQQTTVVVLNYVAPPKPKPITINITKYTCDPGFEATYYADFIDNCGDASSLTNGVQFRVAGPVVQNRTTGSSGSRARRSSGSFLPEPTTSAENVPANAATVYGFCGLDKNAPNFKVVGDAMQLTLGEGAVLYCTWFNVPDDLSDSTGAVLVHKYVCNIQGKIPTNFDWFNNCEIFTTGAKFALSVKQGTSSCRARPA